MKKYTVKPTKKQLDIIKTYWRELESITSVYYDNVDILELAMETKTKIKGIEFFKSDDGGYVGVGTVDRKMKLIQGEDL